MTARRRTTWVITGLVGLAATGAGFVFKRTHRHDEARPDPVAAASTAIGPDAPMAALAEGLGRGDVAAMTALARRLDAKPEGGARGLSEEEGAAWIGVVKGLRVGFLKFATPAARAAAVGSIAPIFARLGVEPAPEAWLDGLAPAFDLLNTGMGDRHPDVRAASMASVGALWSWYPGRALTPAEERRLSEWKDRFHEPVVRKLADPDPKARAAVVACLGLAPIDALAAPAVAYLDDPHSGEVRHQVLVSFAGRPALLTEDMILKRLHDPEVGVPQLAELILRTRGLTKDQIALGRLIFSPRPEMRVSVVGLVKDREDLDPAVWLLRLSRDPAEVVRAKTVEAMAGKDSPELIARLREMAEGDASASVRAAAGRVVAKLGGPGSTASLPPLPGSPSLTPRAN